VSARELQACRVGTHIDGSEYVGFLGDPIHRHGV
jgi:hypothetical protein